MAWSPPAGVVPVDRKSPSVALYADIPAMLDWLRTYYPGHTVVGTLVTARDQLTTYRVDGEPGYGTPGTLSNYILTKVDWGRTEVDTALADIAQDRAAAIAATAAATAVIDAVRGDALYLRGEVPGGVRLYSLDPDRIRANSVTLRAAGTTITASAVRVRFTQ